MDESYSHSGRIPVAGLLLVFVGILPLSALLGFLYSVLTNYIPFIYVNFLLTLALGFLIGALVAACGYKCKIRNNMAIVAATLLNGLVAYYVAWGTDVHARFDFDMVAAQDFFLTYQPDNLLDYVKTFYDTGFWTLGRGGGGGNQPETVSGPFLACVWLVEAGTIFVVAIMTAVGGKRANQVFCEPCDEWMSYSPAIVRRDNKNQAELQAALAIGNPLPLIAADPPDSAANEWLAVDLFACERCQENQYVSLQTVKQTFDKNGEPQLKPKKLIDKIAVARNVIEALHVAAPKT